MMCLQFIMYAVYALGFWYGGTLIVKGLPQAPYPLTLRRTHQLLAPDLCTSRPCRVFRLCLGNDMENMQKSDAKICRVVFPRLT